MREIIEEFGVGMLELLAVLGMVKIIMQLFGKTGILSAMIAAYMNSICG